MLYLQGQIGGEERYFSVAIGDVTQEKFQFQAGDEISGESVPVTDPKSEVAEQYKASQFGFPTGK
ncbi:MAG: hypothetical protein HYS22_05740 [Deltaproteobacteria bacterium]|nr:hypothetical protein [Deltaproteobacteria bacterium]